MNKKAWRQCGCKSRYRDENLAIQYKSKVERQRGIKIDYYYCSICNGYHLTSEEEFENNTARQRLNDFKHNRYDRKQKLKAKRQLDIKKHRQID